MRSGPSSWPPSATSTSATSTSCAWPASWWSTRSSTRPSCATSSFGDTATHTAKTAISLAADTASPRFEEHPIMFMLNDEHEALRDTVRAFAREVIAPVIGDFYERHAFPYDIVRQMGKMGLFGLPFPEEYGGMGGDYFALCLALEELARVDSSVAVTLEAGMSLGAMPIYRYGTEAQKQQWLPRLTSGELLGAFGLTEPGAG